MSQQLGTVVKLAPNVVRTRSVGRTGTCVRYAVQLDTADGARLGPAGPPTPVTRCNSADKKNHIRKEKRFSVTELQ